MALPFDPNRTFFRGINKYKQIHIFIYRKKWGKGLREGSRKKAGNLKPIRVSILKYMSNTWKELTFNVMTITLKKKH